MTEPTKAPAPKRETLRSQLIAVRAEMAALKAEEDRILAILKRQGWEDIALEVGALIVGGAASAALGI